MQTKPDEEVPLKTEEINTELVPGEGGTPPVSIKRADNGECTNSHSYTKSIRGTDVAKVSDLLLNPKTFMSFTDPDQVLWGGTYYEERQLNANLNEQGKFESLQFRSENPKDDSLLFGMEEEGNEEENDGSKFGTWDGVFASCLLNIFGVIMFLRLP